MAAQFPGGYAESRQEKLANKSRATVGHRPSPLNPVFFLKFKPTILPRPLMLPWSFQRTRASPSARRRRDGATLASLCLARSATTLADIIAGDSDMRETRSDGTRNGRSVVGRTPPGHSRTLYGGPECGRRLSSSPLFDPGEEARHKYRLKQP